MCRLAIYRMHVTGGLGLDQIKIETDAAREMISRDVTIAAPVRHMGGVTSNRLLTLRIERAVASRRTGRWVVTHVTPGGNP